MAKKFEIFDDSEGVWRTVGGRRIFIRTGQSLSDAMKSSGKFKLTKKQKEAGERLTEKAKQGAREDISHYLRGNKDGWDKDDDFIRDLASEHNLELNEAKKMFHEGKSIEANKSAGQKMADLNKDSGVRTFADEIKEQKTGYDKLDAEYEDAFKKVVGYNTKRQELYEAAGSDEAYKNLHGKLPEKNAKNTLSAEDYKKYEELTNKYHEGRKKLAEIDDKIEAYKKENPKEYQEAKNRIDEKRKAERAKEGPSGWEILEKEQEISRKTGKVVSVKEAEKALTKLETISKADYDKMPNDYKGTLKELVNTAEFRGENKQELINKYTKMGYDIEKDKTILKNTAKGTILTPVKVEGSNEKYTVDSFKKQGVEVRDTVPKGWKKLEGATTAPNGYEWYSNGKSRFGGEYKNALVKKETKGNNQINDTIRRKAYQKYLKEHPASKLTFDDFIDMRK